MPSLRYPSALILVEITEIILSTYTFPHVDCLLFFLLFMSYIFCTFFYIVLSDCLRLSVFPEILKIDYTLTYKEILGFIVVAG